MTETWGSRSDLQSAKADDWFAKATQSTEEFLRGLGWQGKQSQPDATPLDITLPTAEAFHASAPWRDLDPTPEAPRTPATDSTAALPTSIMPATPPAAIVAPPRPVAASGVPAAMPTGAPPAVPSAPAPQASGPAPEAGGDLHAYARAKAQQYGVDPDVFERQITQESGFNPRAVSPAGAQGIAQFMPATAKGVGLADPFEPYSALDAAARHMRQNLDHNGGDYSRALAAYNAGQGAVDQYGGVPPFAETRQYIRTIMGGSPAPNAGAAPSAPAAPPVAPAAPAPPLASAAVGAPAERHAPGAMVTVRDQWGNTYQMSEGDLKKRPGGSADLTIVPGPIMQKTGDTMPPDEPTVSPGDQKRARLVAASRAGQPSDEPLPDTNVPGRGRIIYRDPDNPQPMPGMVTGLNDGQSDLGVSEATGIDQQTGRGLGETPYFSQDDMVYPVNTPGLQDRQGQPQIVPRAGAAWPAGAGTSYGAAPGTMYRQPIAATGGPDSSTGADEPTSSYNDPTDTGTLSQPLPSYTGGGGGPLSATGGPQPTGDGDGSQPSALRSSPLASDDPGGAQFAAQDAYSTPVQPQRYDPYGNSSDPVADATRAVQPDTSPTSPTSTQVPVWDESGREIVGYRRVPAAQRQNQQRQADGYGQVQSTPGEPDYVPQPPNRVAQAADAVANHLASAGGMLPVTERMRVIQNRAAIDQGLEPGAITGMKAVYDPGWRAQNPDLANEYDDLGAQLGMTVAAQTGDAQPVLGRAGQALREAAGAGRVAESGGTIGRGGAPMGSDPNALVFGDQRILESPRDPNIARNAQKLAEAQGKSPSEMTPDELYSLGLADAVVVGERARAKLPAQSGRRYYHVADPSYQDGDPLLSYADLQRQGRDLPNKWESDFPDYPKSPDARSVTFADSYAAAHAFNEDFLDGKGVILAVDVPRGARLRRNSEGYVVKPGSVPSEWVARADSTGPTAIEPPAVPRQGIGSRIRGALDANAERVGAADARMAEQGSTQLPGTLGVVTGNPLEANTAARARVIPPHVSDTLDFPVRVPTDPAVIRAIEAAGGSVDPERGVNLHTIRMEGPEAHGKPATRSSVFAIAGKPGEASPYAAGEGASVGGSERIEGPTTFRSPLVLSDAPGSNTGFNEGMQQLTADREAEIQAARQRARDAWDAYSAERSRNARPNVALTRLKDAFDEATDAVSRLRPGASTIDSGIVQARRAGPPGSPERARALKDLVGRYGGDVERVDDLLAVRGADHSESAWAIKENILAHNARAKGYDGVLTVQPRSPDPKEIAAHPAVKSAEAERFDINRRLGQIGREVDERAATLPSTLSEEERLKDPQIAKLVDEYNQLYKRRDQMPQMLEDAKTQAYRELSTGRITELADFRESHNPTPGALTEPFDNIRIETTPRGFYRVAEYDGHGNFAGYVSGEYRTADLAESARTRYIDQEWQGQRSEPGYTLRSDLPRRPGAPDVPTSTIVENPRLAAIAREYDAATAAEEAASARFDAATRAHNERPTRENWQEYRAAGDALAEASRRLDAAAAAHHGMFTSAPEPAYVTANASAGAMAPGASTDRLGAANRALGQGAMSTFSGGTGAAIADATDPGSPQGENESDATYAIRRARERAQRMGVGFAAGALLPLAASKGARAVARRVGAEVDRGSGARISLGDVPPSKINQGDLYPSARTLGHDVTPEDRTAAKFGEIPRGVRTSGSGDAAAQAEMRAAGSAQLPGIPTPGANRTPLTPPQAATPEAVAAAASRGPVLGQRLNRPIAPEPSGVPRGVRSETATTDINAGSRWAENILYDTAGTPRPSAGSMDRPSNQARQNWGSMADQRVDRELAPAVKEAGQAGLQHELPQYLQQTLARDRIDVAYSEAKQAALDALKTPQQAEVEGQRALARAERQVGAKRAALDAEIKGTEQRAQAAGAADTLQSSAQAVWDNSRRTLEEARDAGTLSQDDLDHMERWPHWTPATPLSDMLPGGRSGPKFLDDAATSGRGEPVNPIVAARNATVMAQRANQENIVAQQLLRMYDDAHAMGGVAHAPGGARQLFGGDVPLTATADGEQHTILVPKAVADGLTAITGMGVRPESAPGWWRAIMHLQSGALTASRPAFIIKNTLRDFDSYMMNTTAAEGGPQHALPIFGEWMKQAALAAADIARGQMTARTPIAAAAGFGAGALQGDQNTSMQDRMIHGAEGAVGATFLLGANKIHATGQSAEFLARGGGTGRVSASLQTGQRWYRDVLADGGTPIKTVADFGNFLKDWGKDIISVQGVKGVNERGELIGKTAAMVRADQRGAAPGAAVLAGKDVTYDPDMSGTAVRALNNYVQFLNATVQGGAQAARLWAGREGTVKERLLKNTLPTLAATTLVTAPIVALAEAWNRSDPQRADDYDNVSQFAKDAGIVWMLPSSGSDARGARPQYIVIPTELSTPMVVGLRAAFQNLDKVVPGISPNSGRSDFPADATPTEKAATVLNEMLSVFHPLRGDSPGGVATSLVPPVFREPASIALNKDFSFGGDIATPSSNDRATTVSRRIAQGANAVGRATNNTFLQDVQPASIDHLIRNTLPSYGDVATGASDMAAPGPYKQAEQGRVANVPFLGGPLSGLVKDSGGANLERAQSQAMTQGVREVLSDANMHPADAKLDVPSSYKGATLTRDEQLRWQEAANGEMARTLPQARRDEKWRSALTRDEAVKAAVSAAQQTAAERVFRNLTDTVIQQRQRAEQSRQREVVGAR